MTKVSRTSLQQRTKRMVKKVTTKHKRLVSDESTSTSSDDTLPILPPTSAEDSSENEESPQVKGTKSSNSSSEYLTSTDMESSNSAVTIPGNYQQLLNEGVSSLLSGFLGVSVQSDGNSGQSSNSTAPHVSIDMLAGGMLPSGLAQSLLSGVLPEGLLPGGLAESLLSGNLPEGLGNLLQNGLAANMPSSLTDLNKNIRSKNFSSGMMNMALLAANGNQLKYLLESADDRPLFIISVSLIGACIVIQIFIKVCLLISSHSDATDRTQEKKVNRVNKLITYATSLLAFCTFCLTGIAIAEMKGIKLPAWLRHEASQD